jgi:hypothetical protein
MRSIAGDVARGAQELDEENAQNQGRFERLCQRTGLDPSGAAAALLRPPEIALRSCRVEVSVHLADRETRQADVGLVLAGRLTHSFYQARFETESARSNRLAIEVVAAPEVQLVSPQATENSQHGINGSADQSA